MQIRSESYTQYVPPVSLILRKTNIEKDRSDHFMLFARHHFIVLCSFP